MDAYNLCFVINRNYIGQFMVSIVSLFENNKEKYIVHLLHKGLTNDDENKLKDIVEKYNNEINFYEIDDSIFNGLPKMGYDSSYTAYYKVLIPYKLSFLDNVLYLDCDLIVRSGLKSIFEIERKHFITATKDLKINNSRKEHVKLINGSLDYLYFNSGVMLFDFKYKDEIVSIEEIKQYIFDNTKIIRWHDQDILNHFYAKNCCELDEKYNYLTTYKGLKDLFLRKGSKTAVVVHYANWKPWNSNYIGKCYGLYKKYYKFVKRNYDSNIKFLKRKNVFSQFKLIMKYVLR